jgi:hypothetical protein
MEAIYLSEQMHKSRKYPGRARGCSLKDSSFSRLRGKDDFAVSGKKHLFLHILGTLKAIDKRKNV